MRIPDTSLLLYHRILDTLDTPVHVCGYSRMSDTVVFSVSMIRINGYVRWLDGSMARGSSVVARWLDPRWLDGGINGSIDVAHAMWLDGSMLTEDVFSFDALMPDSMPVLMPSSMLARCVARCSLHVALARRRLDDDASRCLDAGASGVAVPEHVDLGRLHLI